MRTSIVESGGRAIKVESEEVFWGGEHAGWHVWINGYKFVSWADSQNEAEVYALSRWLTHVDLA